MTTPQFDTLRAAKTLKQGGFDRAALTRPRLRLW